MNLSPTEYQLLAVLGPSERSGRELAKLYREEAGKSISYGTLYTTFRRLAEKGFVAVRDDADDDGRVRFFRLTGSGANALNGMRKKFAEFAAFALPK